MSNSGQDGFNKNCKVSLIIRQEVNHEFMFCTSLRKERVILDKCTFECGI